MALNNDNKTVMSIMREMFPTVLAVALYLVLCGGVAGVRAADRPDTNSELLTRGQHIAEKNCKRCHAIDKASASAHKSAPEFRSIVKRYSPWTLAESLAEGIVTGHPDMPEFKFDPAEILALLSYMDTLSEDTRDDPKQRFKK